MLLLLLLLLVVVLLLARCSGTAHGLASQTAILPSPGRNAQAAARDVAGAAARIRSEAAAGTASALGPLRDDVERLAARRGDDLLPRLDSRLAVQCLLRSVHRACRPKTLPVA